jgi:nucleoid-associated protein YgaU
MPRYKYTKIINNTREFYEFLRKDRQVKTGIRHMATVVMKNPSARERASLKTTKHIWSYGDRFYNLANQYYGEPTYWWVIAWYNGYTTEVTIRNGDMIYIPLNLENALTVLGAY